MIQPYSNAELHKICSFPARLIIPSLSRETNKGKFRQKQILSCLQKQDPHIFGQAEDQSLHQPSLALTLIAVIAAFHLSPQLLA